MKEEEKDDENVSAPEAVCEIEIDGARHQRRCGECLARQPAPVSLHWQQDRDQQNKTRDPGVGYQPGDQIGEADEHEGQHDRRKPRCPFACAQRAPEERKPQNDEARVGMAELYIAGADRAGRRDEGKLRHRCPVIDQEIRVVGVPRSDRIKRPAPGEVKADQMDRQRGHEEHDDNKRGREPGSCVVL